MTAQAPKYLTHILCRALAASIISLAAAYTAEWGFGLTPCHLCIAQRVPFALVIVLSILGLWRPRRRVWLILIIGAAFFINSGIATYHAAVEKHVVAGPSGCTVGEAKAVETADDILSRINAAPIVACDQPQWEFHGITMADMNAVWCLFLSVATFAALQQARKKGMAHA